MGERVLRSHAIELRVYLFVCSCIRVFVLAKTITYTLHLFDNVGYFLEAVYVTMTRTVFTVGDDQKRSAFK